MGAFRRLRVDYVCHANKIGNVNVTYDVLFLALARDCAATIPGALQGLSRMQTYGLNVHLLVGENGSQDDTRNILDQATESGMVTVLDTSFMSKGKSRLEKMALGRQYLADRAAIMSSEVVAVVDLDEPFLESLDPKEFSRKVARVKRDDFFALAASSFPTYYDLLAFEDDRRSFTALEQEITKLQRRPFAYYRFFRDFIYLAQDELTSSSDIECRSAFNGLCLYRSDLYALGSYLPSQEDWVCEHVSFNRAIATQTGRQMIVDGTLKLPTPMEHGRRALPGFVLQRAKKLLNRLLPKVMR